MKSVIKKIFVIVGCAFSFAPLPTHAMQCLNLFASGRPLEERPLGINEINYKTFGDRSKPALFLIPGLDEAWQSFANVAEELSKHFFVVTYDQRGHGQSAEAGTDYSSSLLAQDLLALMGALNIERAHVLGHSLGARTAVKFAATYPDRVISLIIEDMEMGSRVDSSPDLEEKIQQLAKQRREIPRTFPNRNALVEALRPFYGDQAESLANEKSSENPDGTIELLFNPAVSILYSYQGNLESLLTAYRAVSAPALVLQANQMNGSALGDIGLAIMKAAQPNASYVYFENADHTIHRSDSERFIDVLLKFLTQQTTDSQT